MMMKMLEAGGVEPFVDHQREADADNPKGYYEFEKVKEMAEDASWIVEARGNALKVISALLKDLPPNETYKVIFMRRKMNEILASQKKMLDRRGEEANKVSDKQLSQRFMKHLTQINFWLEKQSNFEVAFINYNDMLENPARNVAKIKSFLGESMDDAKMLAVVDPQLYRQRG